MKIKACLIFLLFINMSNIHSQDTLNYENSIKNKQDALLISSLTGRSLFLGTIVSLKDFRETASSDFHFDKSINGYLQVDKLIHSYITYLSTDIFYNELKNANIEHKKALILGGSMSLLMLTQKEIFDGFCEEGGFSWADIAADALGSSLFIGQELLFNEQLIRLKSSFSRSDYASMANGFLGNTVIESYLNDYNGHTYWISLNMRRVFPESKLPEWISIAGGYSANGMFGEFRNIEIFNGVEIPDTKRYRQFLLSADIDWSKIRVQSGFLRTIFRGLNFIKIPFPAVEINTQGNLKGYWLYF